METLKARETKGPSSQSSSRKKPVTPAENDTVQFKPNHLWHNLATYPGSTSTGAKPSGQNSLSPTPAKKKAVQATSSPVQRLCQECEEEKVTDTRSLQTNLAIGAADDPYEREADQVANQVVQRSRAGPSLRIPATSIGTDNAPVSPVQRACSACADSEPPQSLSLQRSPVSSLIQRLCAECVNEESEATGIQRKERGSGHANPMNQVSSVIASPGGGSGISDHIRAQAEPVLNADLSEVRVYSDTTVNQAADSIQARAFTHGNGIYLGSGQSASDLSLMAHELTHTVQQGASPRLQRVFRGQDDVQPERLQLSRYRRIPDIQKIDWPDIDVPDADDVWDAAGSAYDSASDAVGDAYDTASDAVGEAYDTASDAVGEAYDTASEAVGDAYDATSEAVEEAYDAASEAASDAVDWMASEAGRLARRIVAALGGRIRITAAGIEVILPRRCLDPLLLKHRFDEITGDMSVPVFALPVAPGVIVTGDIGVAGAIAPELQIQLGPLCLNAITILLNPFTASASISGGVSLTSAVSLGAEVRGGLTAQLGLTALVPVPPVVVPITLPLVDLEGGIAGMLRGIAAQTQTISGNLSLSGSTINIGNAFNLDMGLAADMFLGAYAQLSLLGQHICRVYWQPYEWHGDIGVSLGLSGGASIIPGIPTLVIPRLNPPTLASLPFAQIPLIIDRSGFSDNCPIKDKICYFLDLFDLYPSRRGGAWNWSGPYGPGPRLPGPLDVYMRNPSISSGSECRGACGPNCDTCEAKPEQRYTDLERLEVFRYRNFQICKSHEGCRQHDAGFDWAADAHGEIGNWDIVMPWHMAANMECACSYPAGNCVAWIMGGRPHDSEMFFADSVDCTPLAHPERFGFEVNEYGVPHILLDSIASSLGITRAEVEELYFERMTAIGIEYREFVIEYVDSNPDDVNLLDAHAIMAYTTNMFVKQLNRKLREGTDTDEDQPLIDNINDTLNQLPDQSGTFYRALGSVPDDFDSRYAVGNVVTEASFLSVSEELNPNYRPERVLVITSEHVKDISELAMDVNFGDIIGHDPVESEHIISPGRRFRVTGNDGYHVHMQEI